MASTFRCTIVTPSESVFDEEVSYVSLPAWDGQIGVMFGRSPLLTRMGIGAMRVDLGGGESRDYWVDGGFAQVGDSVLTILTEHAATREGLPTDGLDDEFREANARAVSGSGSKPDERRKAEEAQQRARSKRSFAASRSASV